MKLTREITAMKYKDGKNEKKIEEIVFDETVSLKINDTPTRNFSTLPDSLIDFAAGYMIGEGIIKSFEEIEEIEVRETTINAKIENYHAEKDLVLGSDSSGGWRSRIKNITLVKSYLKIKKDELIINIEKLRKNADIWQKTGGTHVAAFVNNKNNEFIVREDVSRHVAVDKVIGAASRKKLDFSQSYVIYSGRMPVDMVIKIARVGIPILASNAAPSFSGYTTAEKANITLVGFIRGDRFNIYTHTDRIEF
ncbi:Protein FdhD [Candidatus Methanobinarius endosymbioticus]|uniref:Protein FdhD n=1 Tax=Candidatus Methanobinarius endosymbioticus TaxID=2006182 RepID=A0A366M8U1_9EURY|nr:Protein FdhD [Candidatus Methanobinarius endosymbioticus]